MHVSRGSLVVGLCLKMVVSIEAAKLKRTISVRLTGHLRGPFVPNQTLEPIPCGLGIVFFIQQSAVGLDDIAVEQTEIDYGLHRWMPEAGAIEFFDGIGLTFFAPITAAVNASNWLGWIADLKVFGDVNRQADLGAEQIVGVPPLLRRLPVLPLERLVRLDPDGVQRNLIRLEGVDQLF